jgi:hypothetical protein
MDVTLSPSTNYSSDDVAALVVELSSDDVMVRFGGYYERKSAGDLVPAIIAEIEAVGNLLQSVGAIAAAGFLAPKGLKAVVRKIEASKLRGHTPQVQIQLNDGNRRFLIVQPNTTTIAEHLDEAIAKVATLSKSAHLHWDDPDQRWVTLDEYFALAEQREATAKRIANAQELPKADATRATD